MEAAFKHYVLDWRYTNCEDTPENLKRAVDGASAMGLTGFNCSIPHNVAIIEHISSLG
jgi:shikimate dehydrogenase